jgi:YD repeat-containing protein
LTGVHVSLDQPFELNLEWRSTRARPQATIVRTFEQRDVVGPGFTLVDIGFEVSVGESRKKALFEPAAGRHRYAYHWDAVRKDRETPTGAYPVDADFILHLRSTNDAGLRVDGHFTYPSGGEALVVDDRGSPFGAGWWAMEVPRIYPQARGILYRDKNGRVVRLHEGIVSMRRVRGELGNLEGATAFAALGDTLYVVIGGEYQLRRLQPPLDSAETELVPTPDVNVVAIVADGGELHGAWVPRRGASQVRLGRLDPAPMTEAAAITAPGVPSPTALALRRGPQGITYFVGAGPQVWVVPPGGAPQLWYDFGRLGQPVFEVKALGIDDDGELLAFVAYPSGFAYTNAVFRVRRGRADPWAIFHPDDPNIPYSGAYLPGLGFALASVPLPHIGLVERRGFTRLLLRGVPALGAFQGAGLLAHDEGSLWLLTTGCQLGRCLPGIYQAPVRQGYVIPEGVHSIERVERTGDGGWRVVVPGGEVQTFDARGWPLSIAGFPGHTTTYAYDTSGRLSRLTDPMGRSIALAYDAAGRVASVTDAGGRRTDFTYDAAGRLVSMRLPDGATRTFGYGEDGLMTRYTDEMGATSTFDWWSRGRLRSVTYPDGTIRQYDPSDLAFLINDLSETEPQLPREVASAPARYTDPRGKVWRFHDETGEGCTSKMVDPAGEEMSVARGGLRYEDPWDAASGLPTRITQGNNVADLTWSRDGRVQRLDLRGGRLDVQYDDAGRIADVASYDPYSPGTRALRIPRAGADPAHPPRRGPGGRRAWRARRVVGRALAADGAAHASRGAVHVVLLRSGDRQHRGARGAERRDVALRVRRGRARAAPRRSAGRHRRVRARRRGARDLVHRRRERPLADGVRRGGAPHGLHRPRGRRVAPHVRRAGSPHVAGPPRRDRHALHVRRRRQPRADHGARRALARRHLR